ANAFMDALAHYRRQQGLPGLSINWGAWAAGMAARTTQLQSSAMALLTPDEGMAALARLWSQRGQISVAALDWEKMAKQGRVSSPLLADWLQPVIAVEVDNRVSLLQEIVALPANRRRDQLSRYLQEAVAEILGMRELPDQRTGFADMGMDSLMALELKRRLERQVKATLPATLAFEYPTVDALADYLLSEV
ncbi:MAG: KR domain-containing protein, partial [Caldilineaceae bacterium]|nr:KR domain-containing protein [Caldilineaceae bacterium]